MGQVSSTASESTDLSRTHAVAEPDRAAASWRQHSGPARPPQRWDARTRSLSLPYISLGLPIQRRARDPQSRVCTRPRTASGAFPRTDIPVLFQRSRAPGAESPLSSAVRNVVPDVSPAVTTPGIATASESTRRHLNIVRIRRTSRSGSHIPCPVTQPISESSHLALERIDAFADGSVVRFG